MPRYEVMVRFTQTRTKPIKVWARDEAEAKDKACDIVAGWDDVTETETEAVENIETANE